MPLRPSDLASKLAGQLPPVTLIAGEETLLVEECCDSVIAAATAQGYSERSVHFTATPNDDWAFLESASAGMSLFGDRQLLDIRTQPGHFAKYGSAALRAYLEAPKDDVAVLIRCGALDGRQRNSAWAKAIDAAGAFVYVWPIKVDEFPRWLQQRARSYQLAFEQEAFAWLAERSEGNLLMADQALRRVRLLADGDQIDLAAAKGAVDDASHYDVFKLVDAVLDRDVGRLPRMLRSLRDEGVTPFQIVPVFASQLRSVSRLRNLPKTRQSQMRALVNRIGTNGIDRLLSELALLDQQMKGELAGEPWDSLERVLLGTAGVRTTPGLGASRPDLQRFELIDDQTHV